MWTGDIPPGATVTITGSVTVNDPDTGNHVLTEINISDTPGSNCPTGSADPRCGTTIPVLTPALTITNTPSTTAATPGSTVGYTLAITNTGQTSYTGISVAESFAQMADDAVYDGNALATAGTLSYASPVLTWTGDLAPGATATVTFTVTVNHPDTGDKLVITTATSAAVGSTCPPGTTGRAVPQHRRRAHPGPGHRGQRRCRHRRGRAAPCTTRSPSPTPGRPRIRASP